MSSPDQSPAINSIGPSVPTLLPVLGGLTASGLPLIQNLSCACIKDKKCEEREEKEEERLLILFGGLTADGLPLVQNLVHSRAPLLSPTNVILTVIQQEESNKVNEEVLQEVSTKEGESVPQEVSTKEEAVLLEASTEEGEPVLQEVSTKEGEPVLQEVSTKEGESVLPEVSTKEGESVLLEAPTKEGESVLQEASTEEGESVLPEVSAKEGESVLQEVSTKEGESVLQEVPTTEGESVLQEAPTKEGEPVLQEVSTKEEESVLPEVSAKGESVLPETESTEQNQPGAPELSNTSIEKSIAPVVDSVEQKVEEAKEPHELVEPAPLETPVVQEHTETVPAQQKLDKTRLEKLEQLENDLKQAFLPTQDVPTTNNQPLQTSRLSDEAFLANFLRQLAHFKMTDEEKYVDVVERLRQLEDELKISSSGLPPDPEFSELVGRILKSDYPNADLQIIVNSSRKTTTTKSFYETETPGMVGLNGDQIRELQVKLMGNISSPENAANQPDTTVPSDAVQRREVAEEGYAAPDGSEVVSKKMTRVVTTSQSTVSGLDEHPEAARGK
uniref:Uncharacterized protein n=1 Tax=Acrobeloides nanus TaxID=290746 RepID=A0A914EP40_9BILA